MTLRMAMPAHMQKGRQALVSMSECKSESQFHDSLKTGMYAIEQQRKINGQGSRTGLSRRSVAVVVVEPTGMAM